MATIRKHRTLLHKAHVIVRALQEGRVVESSVTAEVIESLVQALKEAFTDPEKEEEEAPRLSDDERRHQMERMGGVGLPL